MEEKTEALAQQRYEKLIAEAQEKIDDAQTELDDIRRRTHNAHRRESTASEHFQRILIIAVRHRNPGTEHFFLKATTPAMIETENTYLAEQNFFDFRLLSTVGFVEENVEELAALDEIADVEGTISVDAIENR